MGLEKKRTRPEHKVSYSVDHRPWVFDPVTGMRERPQEARSSWDRWPTEAAADATEAAADDGMAAAGAAEGSGGQWWQNNNGWREYSWPRAAGTGEDNGNPWATYNGAVWNKQTPSEASDEQHLR